MTPDVSHEEIMRVHRAECAARGHRWEMVEAVGKEDPIGIHCYHCGRFVGITQQPQLDFAAPPAIQDTPGL